ncbi:MAG: hypothetical protein U9P80_06725 [Thermodesulfobacteriota bacterium]|nr:hypothetical protein [Thermodesulfobacteriota bacterium]
MKRGGGPGERRLETGDWRLKTGDWRPETGNDCGGVPAFFI